MSESSRIRVYLACSLDGFIAGPDGDLSWLHDFAPSPDEAVSTSGVLTFPDLLAQVGAMLMGRRTYDVVAAMGEWPYGALPVLVPTHRPLEAVAPTVRAISGEIGALIDQARDAAGEKDVYLDGGALVRQALEAGLVDELCLTQVPILLGEGVSLFAGLKTRQRLEFVSHHDHPGGMVQLTARLVR